ncbi:hypothetical protein GCM10018771_19580 [Streptomyces cellulosae]|nr:hypothetical protein GCM10018771_19580 [Streptomyces cellulosae]
MPESFSASASEAVEPFSARPLTVRCQAAFADRGHACLGISPFNSHFSAERVASLARWALGTFERVHFFVPDTAAVHTLRALGYAPDRAAWKARRQGQYVRNKITRALSGIGVSEPERYLLDGQALTENAAYGQLLELVERRYREDQAFARACLEASA